MKVNRKYSEERYDEYQTDNNTYIMQRLFIRPGWLQNLAGNCREQRGYPAWPEGVKLMTETELRETLIGNTYEGDSVKHPGSTYIEFIQPDGTIRGLWDGKDRYKGEWVISGQVWCYKYKGSNGCSTMARTGNTIFWYALDGTTRGGKSIVMAGDPKNLAQ